jgi:GNAT superfamily N-acetyltransferase
VSDWSIQLFSKALDRNSFVSGEVSLDHYLHKQMSLDVRRKVCAAYVACRPGSEVVSGYYTISAATARLSHLLEPLQKKLPKYPDLPCFLIGRLAVSQDVQGQGLGRLLLVDALLRCLELSRNVGATLVLVDPVNSGAVSFYRKFNFQDLDGKRLFLPLATVASLLNT